MTKSLEALKPVGKFMFEASGARWHHIKHGEAKFTEPRLVMVKLYSEETVTSLIAALELSQQYTKQRDEENQDLMLTIGRLRIEREQQEASALCVKSDAMREVAPLCVKLQPRRTADDFVDEEFSNEDLAMVYNSCRLECEVRIKNAGGTVEGSE